MFDKLLQVLRFGCSYQGIADSTCSATTIRARRDEWIGLGIFAQLKRIALDAYDRIVGLLLDDIERHEALLNRVEVGDLHRRVVAAAR